MISGIGLDIVELQRIKKIVERQSKFVNRILTPFETESYEQLSDKRRIEYLAGRFAAKEAFAKAFGTGIGENLSFLDIQIENDEKGKPYIRKPFQKGVHLTITHSAEYAAAQVIIEK
ncbi:holo-ACP synthase [Niallia endozanthoxylica]|uniref:Holo-[acyl-carrier-protein] synthase n=1 Tax=Niallia endozanthoxylica TaxID=2036016 RepID=A0A5J5H8V3_9BACI|nr:holo-ACP synthase [Niallia endozanthoxylica]KAA9017099.1 holo-ACP synthase [Niallia endozanthoxylica]